MIGRKDRSTVFQAEYRFLDIINARLLLLRSCTKMLADDCRSLSHVISGRVLLAHAQMLQNLGLLFGVSVSELVVVRTVATEVIVDNHPAPYGCGNLVRFGVPPAHSAACDNFHQRIPQHSIISGTNNSWILCTMPPLSLDRISFSKVSPG